MSAAKPQNFFYLFAGLLFLVLVVPLYRDLTGADYQHFSELAFSVFLIIGVWTMQRVRRWFPLAVILAGAGVLTNLLAFGGIDQALAAASMISYAAFLMLAISLAVKQVFASGSIELNNIVGAICIYLLLGVIWAIFYTLTNSLIPGSFGGEVVGSVHSQFHDFLYFSMVTLTSLGYGDITPTGSAARALATIEVVFGQFYIAVLVAGLVAAYLQRADGTRR